MGLIRNAVSQGAQAVEAISERRRGDCDLDLVIIGAGPAGIAASLTAMSKKLSFITLEQDTLGGTVSHYPRGKIVMTAPVKLPIVGKMHFKETTKEALMDFWQGILDKTGLKIQVNERVEEVLPVGEGFRVKTRKGEYLARSVLLTIGRRGTPRKLGVAGEEQNKVVYRLTDPEQYSNQHVLVVGGGDSALEAAISISEAPGTTVTLSYRSEAFSRAKQKNRDRINAAEQAGRLNVLLQSNVKQINAHDVVIATTDGELQIDNDAIIVCAGGILPTPFLKTMGIEVETKFGSA
jgi:thioredoxin reductase